MTSATNMEQNCAHPGNPVPQERAAPTVRLFRAQVTFAWRISKLLESILVYTAKLEIRHKQQVKVGCEWAALGLSYQNGHTQCQK